MRVHLTIGSLADQDVDAVVRLAPPGLVGRRADGLLATAGPEVAALCRQLKHSSPGCATVRTPGGRLAARWLAHVVVPAYSVRNDRTHLLCAAYRELLRVAGEVGARTLALTPLGCAPPYWPLEEVVRVCLLTLYGTPSGIREVRLVLSNPAALEVFAEALARR